MQKQNQLQIISTNEIWKKLPKSISSSLHELKNLCYEFSDYLYSDRGIDTCENLYERRFRGMQEALVFMLNSKYKIETISKFICDYYNTKSGYDYKQIAACHEFVNNIVKNEMGHLFQGIKQ